MFHITPEEWEILRKNAVYRYWSTLPVSSITATNLTTAIQAVQRVNGPEALAMLKYLHNLRDMVNKDTAGRLTVAEGGDALSWKKAIGPNFVGSMPSTYNSNYDHKISTILLTVAGGAGAVANTTMLAAVSGYFGVIRFKYVLSNATSAASEFTFTDADNNTLYGIPAGLIRLNLAANVIDKNLEGITAWRAVDNKLLRVSMSSNPAMADGSLIWIGIETWYET